MSLPKRKNAAWLSGAAWALWTAFVFSNSLKDRAASADQSEGAEGLVRRLLFALGFTGDAERVAEIAVRKTAHVFEFFVLALIVYITLRFAGARKRTRLLVTAAVSVATAAADECLQIISKRGASPKDVVIDSIGIVLALGLVYLLLEKKDKNK